jgi:hypothetical protein
MRTPVLFKLLAAFGIAAAAPAAAQAQTVDPNQAVAAEAAPSEAQAAAPPAATA